MAQGDYLLSFSSYFMEKLKYGERNIIYYPPVVTLEKKAMWVEKCQ